MTKVMIDTNIIISAVLFPGGQAAKALQRALGVQYEPIVCDYILDELERKFKEKFPHKMKEYYEFIDSFPETVKIVKTPSIVNENESKIRDPKDRPILRAALNEHADLFLTGDKDFLESSVEDPG